MRLHEGKLRFLFVKMCGFVEAKSVTHRTSGIWRKKKTEAEIFPIFRRRDISVTIVTHAGISRNQNSYPGNVTGFSFFRGDETVSGSHQASDLKVGERRANQPERETDHLLPSLVG